MKRFRVPKSFGRFYHLPLQSGEDGGHRDHGGGADQYAEDGQERRNLWVRSVSSASRRFSRTFLR